MNSISPRDVTLVPVSVRSSARVILGGKTPSTAFKVQTADRFHSVIWSLRQRPYSQIDLQAASLAASGTELKISRSESLTCTALSGETRAPSPKSACGMESLGTKQS